ncbi:hypothetical protein ACQRIU_001758 [Beauveria bassiana]
MHCAIRCLPVRALREYIPTARFYYPHPGAVSYCCATVQTHCHRARGDTGQWQCGNLRNLNSNIALGEQDRF